MKKWIILIVIIVAIIFSYIQAKKNMNAENIVMADKVAQAQAILTPIKKQFKQTLKQGMAQGAVHAVDYCNIEAPEIIANLPEGVEVGRTSHKLRNPANAPAGWLKKPLEQYLELEEKGKQAAAQMTHPDEEHWVYVEPIYTKPLCLTCHGDNLSGDVKQAIDAKYPEDQATGFKENQFRGLFWVILKN